MIPTPSLRLVLVTLLFLTGGVISMLSLQTCQRFDPEKELVLGVTAVETMAERNYKFTGNILNLGSEGVSQHGFCWSTSSEPDINDQYNELGEKSTGGSFSATLSGFETGTGYYVRAYVTTASGTTYARQESFTTEAIDLPVVTTDTLSNITEYSAEGGGLVSDDGGGTVIARGLVYGLSVSPEIGTDSVINSGDGIGGFTAMLRGLNCGTGYFIRAFATNEAGTAYGELRSITTLDCPVGLPEVVTSAVTGITYNSAQAGGVVSNEGDSPVTARGVCWSTEAWPEIHNSAYTSDGSGGGSYTSAITGLDCGTKYYLRAYATSAAGTAYGAQETFTTAECPAGLPSVSTSAVSAITDSSATGGGVVSDEGGAAVTARGICWATTANPDIENNSFTTDGDGSGAFTSNMSGLNCGTRYYVRAYATNSTGTAYGQQVEFTTSDCPPGLPTVTTAAISSYTENIAEGGGNVTDEGGATVTARGLVWSTMPNPDIGSDSYTTDGTGSGSFTSSISGLDCGTRYYVRAYATNSAGTAYGSQVEFTTTACPVYKPTVTTTAVTNVDKYTATGGGEVTDDGGTAVTARGVVYGTSAMPDLGDSYTTDGAGTGSFTSDLSGLDPGTTYYVRAYATNSEGTSYGSEESFMTDENLTVTDYDGNVYQTVQLGTQIWMAENLKVTHYADGTPIPYYEDHADFELLDYPDRAYNWYNNDIGNKDIYGALYTYAGVTNGIKGENDVPSGIQGVCPDGWHVPSDNEWKILEGYLGMSTADQDAEEYRGTNEGGMLKASGTSYWNSPNTGATNSTGFNALPGGQRHHTVDYSGIGEYANFWTSTSTTNWVAHRRVLSFESGQIQRKTAGKDIGRSVRCVKD